MSDFFSNPKEEVKVEPTDNLEEGKIKVGEQVYEQAELERLVGLGKLGVELEEKWKTKIDRVYPEYTKSRQEIENLKSKLEEREQEVINRKQIKGEELTPEQARDLVRKQAREAGLMSQDDFDQMYVQRRAAERLVDEVEGLLNSAKEKGQPSTTKEDLLRHMQETGIRSPEKAYKDMFEPEIDKWKEEQTKKAKVSGLFSPSGSTAGGKTPPKVAVTKDNLQAMLHEALGGGSE